MADFGQNWSIKAIGLTVTETPLAFSLLRVRAPDEELAERLGAEFSVAWPVVPNSLVGDQIRVAWLAPGEWALFGSPDVIASAVAKCCGNRLYHLTNLSAGRRAWQVAGTRSRDLLAKGCSIDMHPSVFPIGCCAQTLFAQIDALIIPEELSAFTVVADATFSGHLLAWFTDAVIEYPVSA